MTLSAMAIGEFEYALHDHAVIQMAARVLGTPDIHSHLRLRPLLETFPTLEFKTATPRILEIGCGTGMNLFDLSQTKPIVAEGYDLNESAIEFANQVREKKGLDQLKFFCADAGKLEPTRRFDCLMMIDVIEHLENPREVVAKFDSYLEEGGYAIFSVPTPLYPKVMGRRFHEAVGHLVDGYGLEGVNDVVPASYELIAKKYTTGPLTWPACFFFYRYVRFFNTRLLRTLARLAYFPVRFVDVWNGPSTSVSLFIVYQKMPRNQAS